jgi:hypothetical protein
MNRMMQQIARVLAVAAALTVGVISARETSTTAARFYVTEPASALIGRGLALAAPAGTEAAAFQEVPAPGVRFVANVAQSTTAPWINSNGWRFQRGLAKANYATLPAGSAALAAAEAFAFNVDAIFNPDPADVEELGNVLAFLKANPQPPLPVMANIGVVDDGSPQLSEVLNLLTRRNLLYRVVSAPDASLDLTVRLGSADFPKEAAVNPSEFAARVRAKLGDDNRLVRLYGTSTVIARLTGDGRRARLHLLSYGGRGRGGQQGQQSARPAPQQGIRVRVLGKYRPTQVAAYGAPPDAKLMDVENPGQATEFTMPTFTTFASVDLAVVN